MKKPRVCILRTAGTNCDKETAYAFNRVGGLAELLHINEFVSGERNLDDFCILAIPGGFSYGDDLGAGKILANELKFKLNNGLKKFISDGKLVIGICNGFQILVKSGLLPGNKNMEQEASLIINDSAKFEDRWVYLKGQRSKVKGQKCVWARDLPEVIYLPVAHGEGKFVVKHKEVLDRIKKNNQIVFKYCTISANPGSYPVNPNGAIEDIAGICDETGRILGLMPHPERHIFASQHPRWDGIGGKKDGDGIQIFSNGISYAKKTL